LDDFFFGPISEFGKKEAFFLQGGFLLVKGQKKADQDHEMGKMARP
jgi:hypothetical protein